MNLGADVMRDQADNAFAVGCRQPLTRIGKTFGQAVDPQPPVGVEHHFNDAGIVEVARNCWAKRGAQHPRAARETFRMLM